MDAVAAGVDAAAAVAAAGEIDDWGMRGRDARIHGGHIAKLHFRRLAADPLSSWLSAPEELSKVNACVRLDSNLSSRECVE